MENEVITAQAARQSSFLPPATGSSRINVGQTERIISVIAGTLMGVMGVRNFRNTGGKALAITGALLLKRGVTGYCEVNNAIGRNSATGSKRSSAMEVTGTFTINKPRAELYTFWRNLQNLPRFMKHLEEVRLLDEQRSLWKARIPGGAGTVSWEAIIQREEENNYISWTSLPGSTIDNAGEVLFKDAPANAGTEIQAKISYRLPAGDVGGLAGKLFNPFVEHMVREDLRRFKQLMETGEIATVEGQPSARSKDKLKAEKRKETEENKSSTTQSDQNHESPVLERH